MSTILYVIPGSPPARTARLMLEHKGIEYKRRDLIPVVSRGVLRLAGFPGVRVPAMKVDGERIQGSTEIARALDRIRPEPPLFPADQAERVAVEEAETLGHEDLQPIARHIFWNCMRRDKTPLRSYTAGARLGVPVGLAVKTAAPMVALSARFNEASDENVRADLAALPGLLQRIDDWIAAGVIGNEEPNAADFQLATSLGLMMTIEDVKSAIAERPAGELSTRIDARYPGRTPAGTLPAAWLEPLRATVPA